MCDSGLELLTIKNGAGGKAIATEVIALSRRTIDLLEYTTDADNMTLDHLTSSLLRISRDITEQLKKGEYEDRSRAITPHAIAKGLAEVVVDVCGIAASHNCREIFLAELAALLKAQNKK